MKAVLAWDRLKAGVGTASGGRDASLRRVATRLALQTVLLLLLMLIALEVVVYVITQHALVGTLESTLQARARQADPEVCAVFHLPCPGQGGPGFNPGGSRGPQGQGAPGLGGGPGLGGPRVFVPVSGPSEASVVYVDRHLHIVDNHGSLGRVLLIPRDATQAMRTGKVQCCSVQAYEDQNYRVYTAPLLVGTRIVGAVQTSISQHQYEKTMFSLLQALLAVALLGLLTSGGISIVLVRRALQPIRLAMQRQRDFVADAAHELRTPLAIQRTVGEVGIADPSPDELQATVAQMLSENRHLTRLVEDLSLLARADTDAVSIERRPVNLSALVADTAEELGYLAADKEVALQADVQRNITALGDILRLRQLLLILIDNALKHTPAGGTVQVRLGSQHGRARLEVADSGPGIPAADLPRIFDRFYRSDQARTGEGTGLGLAIARWIVEAHGGHIQARNAAPHGAVFAVSLPLARTAASA